MRQSSRWSKPIGQNLGMYTSSGLLHYGYGEGNAWFGYGYGYGEGNEWFDYGYGYGEGNAWIAMSNMWSNYLEAYDDLRG